MVKASKDAQASSDALDVKVAATENEAEEVNVALAAPAIHKTLTKDIKLMTKAFRASMVMGHQALTAFKELPPQATITGDMIAYNDLNICRTFFGKYLEADVPMQIQLPDGLQKVTLHATRMPGGQIVAATGIQQVGHAAARTPPPSWRVPASEESVFVILSFLCA